ncbi:MAG TPA: dynamin family protein, partial [Chondromyces sp.]|nr:dynamin family protein [Chondromyces sp.]
MTLENQLIQKEYYETFTNEKQDEHPIRVLSAAYQEELEKDMPELSFIRFAQGEVYFHHGDYESAIFKWEHVTNELEPWARKNIADTYYETGLLSTAEEIYHTIQSDNLTLNTEVALQLFSLYIESKKMDDAVSVIKETIVSNPDYPNVTDIARAFFEEQRDWNNAIELAVNEAKRTESVEWFKIVTRYVENGVTKHLHPQYFSHAVTMLSSIDSKQFERLVCALWRSYEGEDFYFTWLKEINSILSNLKIERNDEWKELSILHRDTYLQLIDGNFLLKDVESLIPDLLTNWLRLADSSLTVLASSSVLSWSEFFPGTIRMPIVNEAKNFIGGPPARTEVLEESVNLFNTIMEWAKKHEMGENNRLKWMADQLLNDESQHLFVTGLSGSGKTHFINTVIGAEVLEDAPTPTVVKFKDDEELDIKEITDWEIHTLSGISEFQEKLARRRKASASIIEFKHPNLFLHENRISFIDSPGLKEEQNERKEILQHLHIADAVLFTIDANEPFADQERHMLSQIQELAPNLPIHFVLTKMDMIGEESDALQIFDETKEKIHSILPDAKLFAFSTKYDHRQQLNDLKEFIQSIQQTGNM